MEYRGRGYSASRNHYHRGHPGFIRQLGANLATHPLYFLMHIRSVPLLLSFLFGYFVRLGGILVGIAIIHFCSATAT